jgi:hypothetical protein
MTRRMLLLCLAAWAAFTATAHAGDLSAVPGTITYRAAPGEANFFTVNWGRSNTLPLITDHADIRIGAGCQDFGGGVGVECPLAGTDPAIVVHLGDGNDFAQSINDRAVGHTVTFFGEDGDDDLQSDGSADVLDGGPGNDTLAPDDNAPGGGDVVRGGPGVDTLQTGNPTGAAGPITVAFDDAANDGYPGEADNYASDLENLSAPQTAPPIHFTGTDGPNHVQLRSEAADIVRGMGGDDWIDGANGNDQLDGGAGNDTVLGGGNDDVIVGGPGVDSLSGEGSGSGQFTSVFGNDTIDARDGERDTLDCGAGADRAIVDALDVVVCEAVERPPAVKAATLRSASLKVQSRKRVTFKLACPKDAAPCAGKLTIKRGKVRLGSAKYSIAAGTSKGVRVNLTSKGRSLVRKSKQLRVKITVAPTGAAAATKTVTLRR